MNLRERLTKIRQDFETGDTPSEIVEVLNGDIERLLNENVAENALKVGEFADLNLTVHSGEKQISLSSLVGERYLVPTWFRGNW